MFERLVRFTIIFSLGVLPPPPNTSKASKRDRNLGYYFCYDRGLAIFSISAFKLKFALETKDRKCLKISYFFYKIKYLNYLNCLQGDWRNCKIMTKILGSQTFYETRRHSKIHPHPLLPLLPPSLSNLFYQDRTTVNSSCELTG